MKYSPVILLSFFLLACYSCSNKSNTIAQNSRVYTADSIEVYDTSKLMIKTYQDGVLEIVSLYEDSVQKDLCRFYSNGLIEQYVFFNETNNHVRCTINYDSLGTSKPVIDGKLGYFKSNVFGRTMQEDSMYSVSLFVATPPKMYLDFSLFSSSNAIDWIKYGHRKFQGTNNSAVIVDTVSRKSVYYMGVCNLVIKEDSTILQRDTLFYSLNIK